MTARTCTHLDTVEHVIASSAGSEDCLPIGDPRSAGPTPPAKHPTCPSTATRTGRCP